MPRSYASRRRSFLREGGEISTTRPTKIVVRVSTLIALPKVALTDAIASRRMGAIDALGDTLRHPSLPLWLGAKSRTR